MSLFIFCCGLLLGGFLNIIIIRLPREQRLLGRPRCTRTGKPLTLWQLLPVIGWVMQRGRAHDGHDGHDGRPLHWIHPVVELLTATVLTTLFVAYGWSATFFYLSFVAAVLIVTGAIDWTHRYIYTLFIFGATAIVLIANAVIGPTAHLHLVDSMIGGITAGIAFTMLFFFAQLLFPGKSVPFGLGDVYLSIFIGVSCGVSRLMPCLSYGIFLAGAVAAVMVIAKRGFGRHDIPEYMPYGTYLCLGVLLYFLFQPW